MVVLRGRGSFLWERYPSTLTDAYADIALRAETLAQARTRDWWCIAEQLAPAPHLAHPEGCADLCIVLVTVSAALARIFWMDLISTSCSSHNSLTTPLLGLHDTLAERDLC